MNGWAELARAIFAQVVTDLYDRDDGLAGEARAWLFADDEPDIVSWRLALEQLADINLERLRDAVDDAPKELLRVIARRLDRSAR